MGERESRLRKISERNEIRVKIIMVNLGKPQKNLFLVARPLRPWMVTRWAHVKDKQEFYGCRRLEQIEQISLWISPNKFAPISRYPLILVPWMERMNLDPTSFNTRICISY